MTDDKKQIIVEHRFVDSGEACPHRSSTHSADCTASIYWFTSVWLL